MKNAWQPLKKNDKVRIIAPGATCPTTVPLESQWDDLQKCCDILRSWDLEPVYHPRIFGSHISYYNFANTHAERAADFLDALKSDAKAIWSFRGGYGSDRVVHAAIQQQVKPAHPLLFLGFSDVTHIHSYLNGYCGVNSLHCLSMRQLALKLVEEEDIEKTRDILLGNQKQIQLSLSPLNPPAKIEKEITSYISGGNLTIVQSTLGTPWQTPSENTILLLEEVNEAPYRVARILQQLLVTGFLRTTQAILLGDFTPETDMEDMLKEFTEQCPIPVLRYKGIGHGRKNHPIPLRTKAHLFLGKEATLIVAAV